MGANSHVDKSIENPYPFVYDNILGTVNVLELARNINIEKMIYVSTDEIYGPVEGDFLHKENEPQKPGNPYSASKAAGENFCLAYHNTYNVPVMITRTMNNFGERQDSEKFLPKVVNSIKNNELLTIHCKKDSEGVVVDISSRCWLHARNHADAIVFLLENGEDGEIYNVVGERMNVYDLAMKVGEILKKDIRIKLEDYHSFRPGHDMHYGLDGMKLLNMGWNPPVSLNDSLERTVK
jgi:dTDP-glucose 4,6-dehydratase